jgi:lipopolysaccharide transport system permease protein
VQRNKRASAYLQVSVGEPALDLALPTGVDWCMKLMLLGAWRYRHFIISSIKAEFRARFARSVLGGMWMIIHPLAQAAMFALVLAEVLSAKLPGMSHDKLAYAIYLLSGMLCWSLFSEVITRCLTLFIDNGNLLKKILFPRVCLPLIVSGSALLGNSLLFVAVIGTFALLGHPPGIEILWVPALLILTLALALGIGMILGVLNVFIRDVGQVVVVMLQLGFWFTPIVYPAQVVPESFRSLLEFNPMYWIVEGYHNALLFNTDPPLLGLGSVALLSLCLLGFALMLFHRASPEMVDVL